MWLKRQTENFTAWKTHFLFGVYFLWMIPILKYILTKEIDIDGMIWLAIGFEIAQNHIVSWIGLKKWFKSKFIDSVIDVIVAVIGGSLSLVLVGIVYYLIIGV